MSAPRPFLWSVRREIWENRSLYLAPLAVAGVVLFGFTLTALVRLPQRIRSLSALETEQQRLAAVVAPYGFAAATILFASFVVALFYCLDALHGERRDRSILFWKSLPVSDRTTVLAKAAVAAGAVPLFACAVALAAQVAILVVSTFVLTVSGVGAGAVWTRLSFFQMPVTMLYGVAVHVLWFAPLYGWLLLVSAWARRAPLLWAVLPPLALAAFERITFGTSAFGRLLGHRLGGAMKLAFDVEPGEKDAVVDRLSQLDPLRFLASPGLWLGLLAAAAFLFAAIRLRRRREPI